MARKKHDSDGVVIEHGEVSPAAAQELADASNKINQHSQEIMGTYGEGLPYDRSRVVHEARFYMAQSAEAMLEAGRRLVIIKEHEPHGDFTDIVEKELGMSERTARLMMQAAIKYSSPQLDSKRQALAVLGKTKLFELMTEDDESLSELAEGGTIAGKTFDEIDRMTSRELRKALRDAKENLKTKDEVAAENANKIRELQEKTARIKKTPADQLALQMRGEITSLLTGIDHDMRVNFYDAIKTLMDSTEGDHGEFIRTQLQTLAETVEFLQVELGGDVPEWMN